jgi:hypothetical protein
LFSKKSLENRNAQEKSYENFFKSGVIYRFGVDNCSGFSRLPQYDHVGFTRASYARGHGSVVSDRAVLDAGSKCFKVKMIQEQQ